MEEGNFVGEFGDHPLLHQGVEFVARDKLHGDKLEGAIGAKVKDTADVFVDEAAGEFSFPFEAGEHPVAFFLEGIHDFEGDNFLEFIIMHPVDGPHAPLSYFF